MEDLILPENKLIRVDGARYYFACSYCGGECWKRKSQLKFQPRKNLYCSNLCKSQGVRVDRPNISDEELSYIVGFLQGDRYFSNRGELGAGTIGFELSYKDVKLRDDIHTLLSRDFKCSKRERTRNTNFKEVVKSCIFEITNRQFINFMRTLLPSGKKSHTVKPPTEESWFISKDYLRGLYDADGSLGADKNGKLFMSLCTNSEDIKEFVISEIDRVINFNMKINRNKRDNVYNISIHNVKARDFATFLYEDSSIYLERKYSKWVDMLMWVRTQAKHKQRKMWTDDEVSILLDQYLSLEEKFHLINRDRGAIRWKMKKVLDT